MSNIRNDSKSEVILLVVLVLTTVILCFLVPSHENEPVLILNAMDQVVSVRLSDGKMIRGVNVDEHRNKGYRIEYE
jgi:hypothetical protein